LEKIKVKIKTKDSVDIPKYETFGSSGIDLRANIEKDIILKSNETILIPTGIFIEIPKGYEAQIRSRSGMSLNHGVIVLNSPGTIDSDYRGEIKIILFNISKEDFIIKKEMRIAQMVFNKIFIADFEKVENINETKRGEGGFGHTGKH
jgi:dUTP pyrophosphatase